MKEVLDYLTWGGFNKFLIKSNSIEIISHKFKKFGGSRFLNEPQGNDYISSLLESDFPFMIARYGANELAIMRQAEEKRLGIRKEISVELIDQFCNGAGFFPSNLPAIENFVELMINSGRELDLLGVWMNPVNAMENYFVKKYTSNIITTPLTSLEPWYHNNPWSRKLKGKNVLVIHPFSETIKSQYKKRQLIYPDGLLPEFNLFTIKAVQTIAGQKDNRFKTWFDALEYMYFESQKIDFDIAIIGCGAYGFPLASLIKKNGKKAIHLGGATQLLFGIKGRRWDEMPKISMRYNKYWTRPNKQEVVNNNITVENGCYW